jgi:hypothetical protein
MFKYILRSFYRGSGNVKTYTLTIATLEAILLMILYAPAGYLDEVLEVVPRPSISISEYPPGAEMYYGYFNVGGSEFLVISSKNTTEILGFLTGRNTKTSSLSIGCKIDSPNIRGYLENLTGRSAEALECIGSFIDYTIIVEQSFFQHIVSHRSREIQRVYLRDYVDDGVAAPSAYTVAKDLLKIVGFHQNLLYASSTIIFSIICLILGLRASNDIKQILALLSEMHIPVSRTFFYMCLIYLGVTVVGVFAGYGLAHLITPLTLIFLRWLFKIPYIYAGLDIGATVTILPTALLSFLSYTIAISWIVLKRR